MSADEMKDIIAKDRLQFELSKKGSKNKNSNIPKSVSSKSKKASDMLTANQKSNSEKSSAVSSGGDPTDKSLAQEPSTQSLLLFNPNEIVDDNSMVAQIVK